MLFNNDTEWYKYSSFNKHFPLELVKLDLEDALETYVLPFLSDAQYTALENAYQTAFTANPNLASLSPAQANLLHHVRRCLGGFASWLYAPQGAGQMTSGGFMENSGANDNLRSASKWRTEAFQLKLERRAWNSIDLMLKFLEKNKTDYSAWASSSSYTVFKECFINTTADFNALKNINNSVLMFYKMRGVMKQVENTQVKAILHTTLYNSIKSQIAGGTINAANNKILNDYIKPAVAHLTYGEALRDNVVSLGAEGITVPTVQHRSESVQEHKDGATLAQVNLAVENALSKGKLYLMNLKKYLDSHLSDFSDYTSDADYVANQTSAPTNDPTKKSFLM